MRVQANQAASTRFTQAKTSQTRSMRVGLTAWKRSGGGGKRVEAGMCTGGRRDVAMPDRLSAYSTRLSLTRLVSEPGPAG